MRRFKQAGIIGILASTVFIASHAYAEVKVGVILSLTGPAASLGIPVKNTIDILPRSVGGEDISYIVLDDASDPSAAVRAAKKLIEEEKVDIIFGPSVTPTSLAVVEVAGPAKTAMVSAAGSAIIARPVEGNKEWVFKTAPEEPAMAARVYGQMDKDGDKTVGFIGFNDAFGDSFIGAFKKVAATRNIEVVADERYNSKDTSVTAQVLSVLAAAPDAVVIGASGTPGVTPVLELRNQGYEGAIYINQGMANPDVLRVGKDGLNGVMLAVPPVLVAEQLADNDPIKPVAMNYIGAYEAKYGEGSRSLFGATIWDAYLILENAIPRALPAGKPGTEEFRTALRDAYQTTPELIGTQAIFNMSATDHNGTDERAEVLAKIQDGKWVYLP